jgi:hypothetical protein
MREYTGKEIEQFLTKMDSHLQTPIEIILIGGTAAILAYHISDATQDIDTWNNVEGLKEAYEKAKKDTGFDIPLSRTTVADPPYHFEDRLTQYNPKVFQKLIVKVPEVMDLILMKAMRGYAHDMQAIEEMVKHSGVKYTELADRFVKEMGSALTPERKRNLNFLALVERCFPEEDLQLVEKKISKR